MAYKVLFFGNTKRALNITALLRSAAIGCITNSTKKVNKHITKTTAVTLNF